MFAEPKRRRSLELRALLKRFRGVVWGATATPIPNRPIGAWNLFDMLWPRRFGAGYGGKPGYAYVARYLERIFNKHGSTPGGLAPEHEKELQARLRWILSRTTRDEVPELLPSLQIRPLSAAPGTPVTEIAEQWRQNAQSEATHVVVLTHRRKSARAIAESLRASDPDTPLIHVDGSTPPTQRVERLDWLKAQPRGVLVSTMHAVARSISLSWCTRGLIAELYWSPERLVQVAGRFARIDGIAGSILDVACGANTVQERIAYSVSDKLWDTKKLMLEGATEAGLLTALGGDQQTADQRLLDAALSVVSDEEYEALIALGDE